MRVNIKGKTVNGKRILGETNVEFSKKLNLIVGESGSGKTTFIRDLVPAFRRNVDGYIEDEGFIGYVSQNPDNQLVCDKVWHELAFGLESIGTSSKVIRNRVAEVATFMGIENWLDKEVSELSGGQKQKVVIASILCMNPSWIVMDEPTSMLDPIATKDFWELINLLKRETSCRFIVVEHNIDPIIEDVEEVFEMCDGVLKHIEKKDLSDYSDYVRLGLYRECESYNELTQRVFNYRDRENTVECYKNLYDVRKGFGNRLVVNIPRLQINRGVQCWVGPNGSGKSTLAKIVTGFYGKKLIQKSIMMPQDVLTMFCKDTVREELESIAEVPGFLLDMFDPIMDNNPLDCSGGEQHLIGIAKVFLSKADLIILDEPTKGMDKKYKEKFKRLLDYGKARVKSVVVITHDLDLAVDIADYVVFLFNREIASEGSCREVFENNLFYKPKLMRLTGALRMEDLI